MTKIDVVIQKTSYVPGDTISGNVTLTLKSPVKARGLSISLVGEYRTTQTVPRVGTLRVGGAIARGRLSYPEKGMLMHSTTTNSMRGTPRRRKRPCASTTSSSNWTAKANTARGESITST